ncbi:hypothetical protein R2R35_06855 [Anaerocolumna sp. AGMB13020]|uniref:hypothetical protein n=1 Tax=Anaerocolumna sp. AGMB13020 TaxID=3081750 RepID=UPI002954C597|nr:hypothetical protein [Anaerocolumna sp. AGMB13020]WOO38215.1 hypothetical protein R2R35_06855 [Anaerocolumna sp. AGMB13020]
MYYWDLVGDFFHISDNERKREEYKEEYREEYSKLLQYRNKKIPKEEELYHKLKTVCDMAFKIIKGTETKEILAGKSINMYDNKFSICQPDTTNLLILQRGVAKW